MFVTLSHACFKRNMSRRTSCRNVNNPGLKHHRGGNTLFGEEKEMIVNIPLNIDETAFEGQMSKDIENKVVRWLSDEIKNTLKRKAYGTELDGLKEFVIDVVEKKIDSFRDEIIETASKELANKLARSKKGKEILGNLE